MMKTVQTVDGHEAEVVTMGDLLSSERALRRWMIGSFGSIIVMAVTIGVLYGRLMSDISALTRRVEEIRTEGSQPLRNLQDQLVIIRERQNLNTDAIRRTAEQIDLNRESLIRIEARLGTQKAK